MWAALTVTFVVAVGVACGAFYAGWDIIGARRVKSSTVIDSTTLFDLVKLSFGVVAGAGALVALVVAYRRQRIDENAAFRDAVRLHTERFSNAVDQLGNESSAAVRLGGVHSLAALADDAPTAAMAQTCVDVLCAYLRLPGESSSTDHTAEWQVRNTIVEQIQKHLSGERLWDGLYFNLSGAILRDAQFVDISPEFSVLNFQNAIFKGSTRFAVTLGSAGARMDFDQAQFEDEARFVCLSNPRRRFGTSPNGRISFRNARFTGSLFSTLIRENGCWNSFAAARFEQGQVTIHQLATDSYSLNLNDAQFHGARVSIIVPHQAALRGLPVPLPDGVTVSVPGGIT